MDWKTSTPLKRECFKNYTRHDTTLGDAKSSTMLDNLQSNQKPNFGSYLQAAFVSPSKMNSQIPQDNLLGICTFGSINFSAELISLQSSISPTHVIYKVYPDDQSPFFMEVSHQDINDYEDPSFNTKPTTSYSMKPHVLNPEAEEYIPKTMRAQQNTTSSSNPSSMNGNAPYFNDFEIQHLVAATEFLISSRDNKQGVKESLKFKPTRLFSDDEKKHTDSSESKLFAKNEVGMGEESSEETLAENQEEGHSSSSECECDKENLGSSLSQTMTPISLLSVFESLSLSDSESLHSSNETKETQNLTSEILEDNLSCFGVQIPDSKKMVSNSVFTNELLENSLFNSSNDKIVDESDEDVDVNDSDNSDDDDDDDAGDSDFDNSICFECVSDDEEEDEDDEEQEDTKLCDDEEADDSICFENADNTNDSICFENADNTNDSICFENVDADESISFEKADNTDDSICFENDNTDKSICFENVDADKSKQCKKNDKTQEITDSKEGGENEDDDEDFDICFECSETQGDVESVASDSDHEDGDDDDDEEDSDYNCDLFEVEFSDNEWNLPMGGLVISNIVFQGCCSLDNPKNQGDSEIVNENNKFDEVDSFSEILSMEVIEVNRKWNKEIVKNCCCNTPQKVTFSDDVKIHSADDWCRKGPWEECARDRMRFRRRIDESEAILSPILTSQHRSQVLIKQNLL